MPKAAGSSRARVTQRSRTFEGCASCRRRHVRCDLVRPKCLTCTAVGIECPGFVPDLRWVTAGQDTDGDDANTVRRPLYPEDLREQMSQSLTSGISGTVDACLSEVDSRANEKNSTFDGVSVGPFSVFRQDTSSTAQPESQAISSMTGELSSPLVPSAGHFPIDMVTPSEFGMNSVMSMNDALQWDDLFALDLDLAFQSTNYLYDPLLIVNQPPLDIEQLPFPAQNSQVDEAVAFDESDPQTANDLSKEFLQPDGPSNFNELLSVAPLLLKHFQHNVIVHISALPITLKSPWRIVNLAAAVDSYAHLTFLESRHVSNARRAGLCGLLAIAAHHMSKNVMYDMNLDRPAHYWHSIFQTAKTEATRCLQLSLKEESSGLFKAKYKDHLVATLNLLAASILSGAQRDVRYYMVEAERLMRSRGLAKREISRKSRFLHHMYTWVRIVGESTYVLHDYNQVLEQLRSTGRYLPALGSSVSQVDARVNNGGQNSRLDDFLRFEQTHENMGNEEDNPESHEDTALKDIHLEDSRENPYTMYGTIYGISETWLRLLSQTTRLANHMDALMSTDETSLPQLLLQRAARLEDNICSFAASYASVPGLAMSNYHLHCALNSALVIFFYRRIRHVNAWILQGHVDNVIRDLTNFDQALAEQNLDGPGTVWPAFMAGCEAVPPVKREQLMRWVEKAEARTGFACYTQAKEILRDVWESRDAQSSETSRDGQPARQSNQGSKTWVDALREKRLWLIAC